MMGLLIMMISLDFYSSLVCVLSLLHLVRSGRDIGDVIIFLLMCLFAPLEVDCPMSAANRA